MYYRWELKQRGIVSSQEWMQLLLIEQGYYMYNENALQMTLL